MTHLIEKTVNDFAPIIGGHQTFDFIKTLKPVSVGDILIFEELNTDEDADEEVLGTFMGTPFTGREFKAEIIFLHPSSYAMIKKGYTLVGFKDREQNH